MAEIACEIKNKFVFKSRDTLMHLLDEVVKKHKEKILQEAKKPRLQTALQRHLASFEQGSNRVFLPGGREPVKQGKEYMQLCLSYLDKLDKSSWKRSFHQRQFHADFLRACSKSFFKLDPSSFAKNHSDLLRHFNWDHISQEILISTPRRFGKVYINKLAKEAYVSHKVIKRN